MDIEEQKKSFLNFLRSEYKVKQAEWKGKGYESVVDSPYFGVSLDNFEQENRLNIDGNTLKKYGFEGSDFWRNICLSLKEGGYLEDFGSPEDTPESYYKNFGNYEELKREIQELYEEIPSSYSLAKLIAESENREANIVMTEDEKYQIGLIEKEIEKKEKELSQLMNLAKNSYSFFVVNKDTLFADDEDAKAVDLFVSREQGISNKGNFKEPVYPIKGRRADILWDLKTGKKDGNIISNLRGITLKQLSKDIKNINDVFMEKFETDNKLIMRMSVGGYKLNDKYIIKFIE